jgi:uncharacterized membrane protein
MNNQYSDNTTALGVGVSLAFITLVISYFSDTYQTELLINAACIGVPATYLIARVIQLITEHFPISLVGIIFKLLLIVIGIMTWVYIYGNSEKYLWTKIGLGS